MPGTRQLLLLMMLLLGVLLAPRLGWQRNQDDWEEGQANELDQVELATICKGTPPQTSSKDLRRTCKGEISSRVH
jgi:hypothetical protein